jgi:hypothetical protein
VNVVKFGATPATGQPEYKDGRLSIMVPAGKAGTNVDVSVIFPVDAPLTNSFVVGNYHYDEPTAPNPS